MMMRFFAVCVLFVLVLPVSARKQRTGPKQIHLPTPTEVQVETAERSDTIFAPTKKQIRLSGYDKPNSATKETFFITNSLPDSLAIEQVNVTFTYFDMQERMLHKETRTINCDIPSGETRKISVRSWDSNNAFHYYRSQAPLRRQSTRYKVSSLVNYLIVAPQQI